MRRVALRSTLLLLAVVPARDRGLRLLPHAPARPPTRPSVIPASAPLYAGAIVRPDGSLKAARSAAGADAHPPGRPLPAPRCASCRRPAAPRSSFDRDVAPWLGPQSRDLPQLAGRLRRIERRPAALAARAGPAWAAPRRRAHSRSPLTGAPPRRCRARSCSTPATSPRPAPSWTRRQGCAGAHAASYRGVAYQATSDGVAFGIVDRFAVIGSEDGAARRDRHHARRTVARARDRLRKAPRGRAAGSAGPRLREPAPVAHVRSHADRSGAVGRADHGAGLAACSGCSRARASEHLARALQPPRSRSTPTPSPRARRPRPAGCSPPAPKAPRPSANCRANPGSPSAWGTSARRSAAMSRGCAASPRSQLAGSSSRKLHRPGLQPEGTARRDPHAAERARRRQRRSEARLPELDGIGGDLRERHRSGRTEGGDRDRLQEPHPLACRRRQARRAPAQDGRLGAAGLDSRVPKRPSRCSLSGLPVALDIVDGRDAQRADQVRDRPRRSLRGGRAEPVEHAVRRRLLRARRAPPSAKASSRASPSTSRPCSACSKGWA